MKTGARMAITSFPDFVEITCRCRSGCENSVLVRLAGGRQAVYHPDLVRRNRFIEIKKGTGYNPDTLYRISGAAKALGHRYLVVCNRSFRDAYQRWAKEFRLAVPRFQVRTEDGIREIVRGGA